MKPQHYSKYATAAVAASVLALSSMSTHAAAFTWTQISAATQTWTTATNWASSTQFVSAPANELIFFANTTAALTSGINAITTDVPAALSMNTLTLNGRGNAASGSSATINIASNASTWTLGDGTTSTVNLNGLDNLSNGTPWSGLYLNYDIAANLTLNKPNSLFTGAGTAEFLFSGTIGEAAASYAITKEGSSTLILSGINAYTGGSTISGGTLDFRNLLAKASTGTHAFGANTTLGLGVGDVGLFSTTDVDHAFANTMVDNLSNVTITGTTNIGIDTTAGALDYTTSIAGAPTNGLVKLGVNTLTLSGTSTYTGATTVLKGTLSVDTLAAGGGASNIGAAAAGADGLVLNGGTFLYTGATTTTDRGFTHAGNTNSVVNVAGSGVALTLGACKIVNNQALTFNGGAGSSLTLGPINALVAANQANLIPNIPTTLGPVTYLHSAAQFVIANRGSSTLTYGDITGPGSAFALFLGGQGTVNGVISGFTGNILIGAGGTTVSFLGANTFTGQVDIRQASTVAFNSIKNVGGGASALGAPITAALGTIIFGQVANNQTLRYIGTGDTTDRVLRLAGTTGTVTLEQAGTGPLKFTSPLTAPGAGIKTLVLSGSTAGTGEIAGAIVNNSVTNTTAVSKTGTGKWTLSGVNTYTGATTVNAGTLALVGGSQVSPVTVTATGSLGLTLGSPTTSTSTVSFLPDSKVAITGTVDNVSDYLLVTAAGGITGSPALFPLITSYVLETRNSGTELWMAYNPNFQSVVIDLGAGTTIEGNTFGTYTPSPTNLPLPPLPAGTILRSIYVNTVMTATDSDNTASDLTLLFDPTPGTPGGDFTLAFSSSLAVADPFGATNKINWPISANGGVSTPLVDFKTAAAWTAVGNIDLSTNGVFLGNVSGGPILGGTWSGTITLTYELPGTPYGNWSGGDAANVDTNADSVDNGIAWVVGAASPNTNAIGLVPTLDNTSDPDFFIFNYRRSDEANTDSDTAIQAQYGSDLTGWTTAVAGPDVVITSYDNFYAAGIDKVEVKIRRTLAVGGKLFARLNVVVTP